MSFATAALTASPIPYVKPSLNDRGRIELKQCRHPCIEQMDGINYIPNDAFFSDDGPKFYVITGPNLGKERENLIGIIALLITSLYLLSRIVRVSGPHRNIPSSPVA